MFLVKERVILKLINNWFDCDCQCIKKPTVLQPPNKHLNGMQGTKK